MGDPKRPRIFGRVIIEMLGGPKEHIEKTLRAFVDDLKQNPELEITKEDYVEAEPQDKLFSTFVELELWFKNVNTLIAFCFDAMPSSVEIIEPDEFFIRSPEFAGLLNDLQAKIHRVDMVIKQLRAENDVIKKNTHKLLKNLIILSLEKGGQSCETISTHIGIGKEELSKFLEELVSKGSLHKKGDLYLSKR